MDINSIMPYVSPYTTPKTKDARDQYSTDKIFDEILAQKAKEGEKTDDKPVQRPPASKDTGLQVDDFLKLLASQLQNQDMMNPMKDTEFMGQLAQFTMLQSVNDMKVYMGNQSEINAVSYAMGLVGKTATVATLDKDGKVQKETGEITGVTLYEGQPIIYIGDKGYYLSQIMVVGTVPEEEKPDEPEIDNELPEVPEVDNDLPPVKA